MGRLKNLLKYFYEYSIEFFPVVEKNSTIKGYILRKSALNDINDLDKLKVELSDFIKENIIETTSKSFLERYDILKNLKQFPIVYTDGDIEIVQTEDFKLRYLSENIINYKDILLNSRIGVIVFNIEGKIIFKNKFYEIIENQANEFSSEIFVGEIISDLSQEESDTVEGIISINFDGVEIEYSLSSKLEKDLDGNAIIITSIIPKFEKTTDIENLSETGNNGKTHNELIKGYLKNKIIEEVNKPNFSLRKYLEEQEKFLFEVLSEILDNNVNLISKVLKTDKEWVESKIKHYNFY